VELSPAVDVPVTVSTVLTNDTGFPTPGTAQPVMGSLINYATEFVISSFRRSESGTFICGATVSLPSNAYISDSNTVSHIIGVTTGTKINVYNLALIMFW
jgi:hypothetical protein